MARRTLLNAAVVAVAIAATATTATAATQGSLGSTSTGSVSISASIPSRVRISGLSDVAFTNVDPSLDAANAQDVCVWSNTSTKGYRITASGSGTANAFTLANAAFGCPLYGRVERDLGSERRNGLDRGFRAHRPHVDRDQRQLRVGPVHKRQPDRQDRCCRPPGHECSDELYRHADPARRARIIVQTDGASAVPCRRPRKDAQRIGASQGGIVCPGLGAGPAGDRYRASLAARSPAA